MTVPLGGTAWSYKDEVPSPATEKNDFGQSEDVDKLMAPEGGEWKPFNTFRYGYSHFGVYFKSEPKIPEGWQKPE